MNIRCKWQCRSSLSLRYSAGCFIWGLSLIFGRFLWLFPSVERWSLPPPLPYLSSSTSRIILSSSSSSSSPTVRMYQRGVQGNIRPLLAASSSSSSSPTIQCSGFSSSFSSSFSRCGHFLSAAAHRQPPSPGDARFDPGRWMAVLSTDLRALLYFIIKLLIFLATPRPSSLLLWVRWRSITNPAAASLIARRGKRRAFDGQGPHEGLIKLLHGKVWRLRCCSTTVKVIWSVLPVITLLFDDGCKEKWICRGLCLCPCP